VDITERGDVENVGVRTIEEKIGIDKKSARVLKTSSWKKSEKIEKPRQT
jgi:hypothetical protein